MSLTILDGYSAGIRRGLLHLRALILQTRGRDRWRRARSRKRLKWGSAKLPDPGKRAAAVTIRIDARQGQHRALSRCNFHCQTDLMETFRGFYPRTFVFEGNRALHFRLGEKIAGNRAETLHRAGADLSCPPTRAGAANGRGGIGRRGPGCDVDQAPRAGHLAPKNTVPDQAARIQNPWCRERPHRRRVPRHRRPSAR